jgi:hypothetical protein
MRTPLPRSHPDLGVDALGIYWELMHKTMVSAGASDRTVDGLYRAAGSLGLEIVHSRGYFLVIEPELGFELHAASLVAFRSRVLEAGLADEREIDDLVDAMRAAKHGDYDWVSGPCLLDMTFRKPE